LNEEILRLEGYSYNDIEQLIQAAQTERNKKKEQEELVQLKAQASLVASTNDSGDLRDQLKTLYDMLEASWLF